MTAIAKYLEAVKAEPMNPSRIIMYARNAADEIEELRDWVREVLRDRPGATGGLVNHFGSCRKSDTGECTCKTDRIRELVK